MRREVFQKVGLGETIVSNNTIQNLGKVVTEVCLYKKVNWSRIGTWCGEGIWVFSPLGEGIEPQNFSALEIELSSLSQPCQGPPQSPDLP